MEDDLLGILGDPGTYAQAASAVNDIASGAIGNIANDAASAAQNLTPDYSAIGDLLQTPIAPFMGEDQTAFDTSILGLPSGTLDSSQASPSISDLSFQPLINDLGSLGTGLANAFLINPQNAATQAQAATTNAELQSFLTGNIFSYLLIGLFIFLIFGFLEKEV